MILPFTRFWILVLCATCHAQDFRNGKIFDVSEGRVCEPLKKPENGHLVCQSSKGREKCRLVCDPGYTVPMTFTLLNEQMDPSLKGLYVCEEVIGGVTWFPRLLFDCVKKKEAKKLIFHASVDLKVVCSANNTQRNIDEAKNATISHVKSHACAALQATCEINAFFTCVNTLVGDIEVTLPYSDENVDKIPDFRSKLDSTLAAASYKNDLWAITGQTPAVNKSGFFTDCPYGTRLEKDYTCGGCTKGYFLDPSKSECALCPAGTYQDETLQQTCKKCPDRGSGDKKGLAEMEQCYHSSKWRKQTSIKTLIEALACVVLFGTIAIYYRGTVEKEVTPKEAELGALESDHDFVIEPDIGINLGGKDPWANLAGGDFTMLTNRPARKVNEEIEGKSKGLRLSFLPSMPPPKTADARKSLARERMRMTLSANMMRQSAYHRRSTGLAIGKLFREAERALLSTPSQASSQQKKTEPELSTADQGEEFSFQLKKADEKRVSFDSRHKTSVTELNSLARSTKAGEELSTIRKVEERESSLGSKLQTESNADNPEPSNETQKRLP